MSDSKVDTVNIVAVGDLGPEVDVKRVAQDLSVPISNYDSDFNATYLRLEKDGDLIILYTSGKYVLRGGNDFENMHRVNKQFISQITGLGIVVDTTELEVKNVVSLGDLERNINLEVLIAELGFEHVKYEPEQFPGLVYRPLDYDTVLIVFSTGKVVITGGKTKDENQESFDYLKENVDRIL